MTPRIRDATHPRGQRVIPPCGTAAGYRAHLKWNQPMDEACRLAGMEMNRAGRANRLGICADCGENGRIEARNRCPRCYGKALRAGHREAREKLEAQKEAKRQWVRENRAKKKGAT